MSCVALMERINRSLNILVINSCTNEMISEIYGEMESFVTIVNVF